jgi:NADH-quinone oxidoreductase subunit I
MFGLGIAKGLGVTLKHFIDTFIDDLKYFPKSMVSKEAFASRQGPQGNKGLFTVEYPEMKLKTPENFRFIPFLVTDYDVPKDSPDYDQSQALKQNRCTSCGICSKVCPPQCIWIVRTNDPKTGKPIPQPADFFIDTDICMNCGYCAEFCPFDAIKMDHDYEIADYERDEGHIHNLQRLVKPVSYYANIRPGWHAKEEEARRIAEEEKARKAEEKERIAAERAAKKKAQAEAAAQAPVADKPKADIKSKRTPEEIKAQPEAAKKQAKATQAEDEPVTETVAAEAAIKPEPQPEIPPAPVKPDDLTKVEGIGPKISGLLQAAGIKTFAELANTDVAVIQQILTEAGSRYRLAKPQSWPKQAQLAAKGKWAELKTLQDSLKGGREEQS